MPTRLMYTSELYMHFKIFGYPAHDVYCLDENILILFVYNTVDWSKCTVSYVSTTISFSIMSLGIFSILVRFFN